MAFNIFAQLKVIPCSTFSEPRGEFLTSRHNSRDLKQFLGGYVLNVGGDPNNNKRQFEKLFIEKFSFTEPYL